MKNAVTTSIGTCAIFVPFLAAIKQIAYSSYSVRVLRAIVKISSFFAGFLVQIASWWRRRFFRWGLRRSFRASRPVVSIGNLSFGGTGKTPVVIALARALAARSLRVVILTRGYR